MLIKHIEHPLQSMLDHSEVHGVEQVWLPNPRWGDVGEPPEDVIHYSEAVIREPLLDSSCFFFGSFMLFGGAFKLLLGGFGFCVHLDLLVKLSGGHQAVSDWQAGVCIHLIAWSYAN